MFVEYSVDWMWLFVHRRDDSISGAFSPLKKLRLRMSLGKTNPKIIQPNHYAGVTVFWLSVWLGCRLVCWTYAECLFGLLLAPHASCSTTQCTKTMWKHTIVVFINIQSSSSNSRTHYTVLRLQTRLLLLYTFTPLSWIILRTVRHSTEQSPPSESDNYRNLLTPLVNKLLTQLANKFPAL